MKVLHVTAGNLFGGVETILVTLDRHATLFPEIEPELALCYRWRMSDELERAGAAVHLLGAVRLRQPWRVWQARRTFRRLLADRRIEIVVAHGWWPQVIFGPVAEQSAKLVFWAHDTMRGK